MPRANENIDTERVSNWSRLLKEGVMVSLTIRRYRGYVKLEYSDLGIDLLDDDEISEVVSDYIQPGRKLLLPSQIDKQLKSIETSARQNLAACSFECNALGMTGRFIPKTKYRDFKRINQEYYNRFMSIRDEFATDYDNIVLRVRNEYETLARGIYFKHNPSASRVSKKYVNAFVDRIMSAMPSKDEIVASFVYKTVLSRVPDYIVETSPRPRRKKNFTSPAEEIAYDVAASQADGRSTMLGDFVNSITNHVKEIAFDGTTTVISSIDKNNGKLVGRASIKAHSLVDDLRKMNFYNDPELNELVDNLEKSLQGNDSGRNINDIRECAYILRDWGDGLSHEQRIKRSAKRNNDSKKKDAAKTLVLESDKIESANTRNKKQTPVSGKKATVKVPLSKKTARRTIKGRTNA